METQISEIEKVSEKKLNLSLLHNTKDRQKLLSTKEIQSVIKIESKLLKGARNYFEEQGVH